MVKKYEKKMYHISVLSLIMLNSVVKVKKKYYPQTLLEECKYEIKKNKMESFINDELEPSSSDDKSDSDSDNEPENHLRNLTMNLAMRLIMNLAMNNLLKDKTVF